MSNNQHLFKISYKRCFLIALFYCVLLAGLLYAPKLKDRWFDFGFKRELYMLTYSDVISENILKQFTEETGIVVNKKYVENDSEMLMQSQINDGASYDIVTPTEHIAKVMFDKNYFDELDRTQLAELQNLRVFFQKRCLLRGEALYSIPFGWAFHGIGYKKSFFDRKGLAHPDSLAYIFDPTKCFNMETLKHRLKKYRVCVLDNSQELIFLTSVYAFHGVNDFSPQNRDILAQVLRHQRQFVQAYTDSDVTYYLQHSVPVLIALSAHVKNVVATNPRYAFAIPKEGSIMTIQQCCIPKTARHKDLAFEFVKFILDPKVQAQMYDDTGFAPTNQEAFQYIDKELLNNKQLFPDEEQMERFHSINYLISPKETENLLLQIKAE